MKFEQLLHIVHTLPYFDLATVVQMSGERRESVVQQLYRFSRAGKIITLRRGMYTLSEQYRSTPLQPAQLANDLYRPSYISELWALSYHGMIPEGVKVFTSVTTRRPRTFRNALGEFRYRNVKRTMFFAYMPLQIMEHEVLLATPEKALVDLWYLSKGQWTLERMREMRFSAEAALDVKRLEALVKKVDRPRLYRALTVWRQVMSEQAGTGGRSCRSSWKSTPIHPGERMSSARWSTDMSPWL